MNLPVDSWYNAIEDRHSVRQYSDEAVSSDILDKIEDICDEFRPFDGARAVLVRKAKSDVFKGLIGPLFKVKEAPHYVAFVGDTAKDHFETVLGYLGEGIVLEATSRGLNSCWVTGFFRPDQVERDVTVSETERIIGVTPIGYAEDMENRVGSEKEHSRKPLSKLVESGDIETRWIKLALEAARLAPSAVNRQPWRFTVTPSSITVSYGGFIDLGISKAIDCGIAMLHLELGAAHAGKEGHWTLLSKPDVGRFDVNH